jgi:hypothetical protein
MINYLEEMNDKEIVTLDVISLLEILLRIGDVACVLPNGISTR